MAASLDIHQSRHGSHRKTHTVPTAVIWTTHSVTRSTLPRWETFTFTTVPVANPCIATLTLQMSFSGRDGDVCDSITAGTNDLRTIGGDVPPFVDNIVPLSVSVMVVVEEVRVGLVCANAKRERDRHTHTRTLSHTLRNIGTVRYCNHTLPCRDSLRHACSQAPLDCAPQWRGSHYPDECLCSGSSLCL